MVEAQSSGWLNESQRLDEINELGARGIGEIGLACVAAAVTSALHHATGVHVRELPVKIENLIA